MLHVNKKWIGQLVFAAFTQVVNEAAHRAKAGMTLNLSKSLEIHTSHVPGSAAIQLETCGASKSRFKAPQKIRTR